MARLAALAVLVLSVLAGCGGGGTTAEPATPTQATATGTSTGPGQTGTAAAANCSEQEFDDQGADHVASLPSGFEYNSFPPTSGPHAPQPAVWDLYTQPVPELNLVHNLEHGGVVVQFGAGVLPQDVQAIVAWYLTSPDGLVVAPLPDLKDKIAVTAWRHLMTCDAFDEAALTAFRDAYRFNGPESLPAEAMKRGA